MSSKNLSFVADLTAGATPSKDRTERSKRIASGVLDSRSNQLSKLASGAVVDNPQELVDPARCRIWERHNRDYAALNEARCADLIESIVAQSKQEVPAIVRRLSGDPDYDFEVICGARRHWTVSWLRAHNYPEIRYLVEVRKLSDEQAFRISDLENRAREDLSDLERSRDYLRALDLYYEGKQKNMAARLHQSEAWLSRYLDLARLPDALLVAFPDPFELKISHIQGLKPVLKEQGKRELVLAEAARLAERRERGEEGVPSAILDITRALLAATTEPKRKAAPKKTGSVNMVHSSGGAPILRLDGKSPKTVSLTLMVKGGGSRDDVEAALKKILDEHWPNKPMEV
ncbi:ParB/RepB/Spo0J family partition protein [Novosphingobium terrae]|uniref:ParB/RepB/Spo0J family partition protein n=1 Tax=Novosphingobium terrae TaxID=2726189 RepID=UPI00198235BB|nr:ParB/RepB/Spo0J family partition protein [Novosphingobium terrae]